MFATVPHHEGDVRYVTCMTRLLDDDGLAVKLRRARMDLQRMARQIDATACAADEAEWLPFRLRLRELDERASRLSMMLDDA